MQFSYFYARHTLQHVLCTSQNWEMWNAKVSTCHFYTAVFWCRNWIRARSKAIIRLFAAPACRFQCNVVGGQRGRGGSDTQPSNTLTRAWRYNLLTLDWQSSAYILILHEAPVAPESFMAPMWTAKLWRSRINILKFDECCRIVFSLSGQWVSECANWVGRGTKSARRHRSPFPTYPLRSVDETRRAVLTNVLYWLCYQRCKCIYSNSNYFIYSWPMIHNLNTFWPLEYIN